jgi:hypothetical protein
VSKGTTKEAAAKATCCPGGQGIAKR